MNSPVLSKKCCEIVIRGASGAAVVERTHPLSLKTSAINSSQQGIRCVELLVQKSENAPVEQ